MVEQYASHAPHNDSGLLIAFPTSATELRLIFSEPVDRESAERPDAYRTATGLEVLAASVDPEDGIRVTLTTDTMPTWMALEEEGSGDEVAIIKIDMVYAIGVRPASGGEFVKQVSPRFIQGIPSISAIQKPASNEFPFVSALVNLVASHEYNPNGGTGGLQFTKSLGFSFLHDPDGSPFDSLKIVTRKEVPGLAEAVARRQAGGGLHVLWAGGEIQTVDGETRLVDTGFMEGSIVQPPLQSPPPYRITAEDISGGAATTLRAKGLQGVVVMIENLSIDSVSGPDAQNLRTFAFHDASGGRASGLLLDSVTRELKPGDQFRSLRGVVHQPRLAHYEVIVEMDRDLVP